MTPDQRMTERIAEKVMGLTPDGPLGSGWYRDAAGRQVKFLPIDFISDAVEALKKWRKAGEARSWAIMGNEDGSDYVSLMDADSVEQWDSESPDSIPLAICRALCEATGYEDAENEQ